MKTKTNSNTFAATIAASIVVVASSDMALAKDKAALAVHIAAAFASVPVGNMKSFVALFGNGEAPKSKGYLPGSIAVSTREAIAKVAKAKQQKALDILKTRLSECRRAFKAGIVLADNEPVQAALKRIPKTPAEVKPASSDTSGAFTIPTTATMDEIAEALSMWVATHGNAAAGLSKKLADFLPISTKRTVKSA